MYEYLIWVLMLGFFWTIAYATQRSIRKKILWSSLIALPFGLGELYFIPNYWNPQTLFDLGAIFHIDLEAFALMFFLGGLAAAVYEGVMKRRIPVLQKFCHPSCWCWFSLVVTLASFLILVKLFPNLNIIWPSVIAAASGGIFAMIVYPKLRVHVLLGGVLFALFYFISLALMNLLSPGWITSTWNFAALSKITIIGVPIEEITFGFAFGMLWSPLYEEVCSRFS